MWLVERLSYIVGFVGFIFFNIVLESKKRLKLLPGVIALIFFVIALIMQFFLVDYFHHIFSGILEVLYIIVSNLGRLGLLVAILFFIKWGHGSLIKSNNLLSLIGSSLLGFVIGISIPRLIFYILRIRIYNWLPDYASTVRQFYGGVFILASLCILVVEFFVNIHVGLRPADRVRYIWPNIGILLLTSLIGFLLNRFQLLDLPSYIMPYFYY